VQINLPREMLALHLLSFINDNKNIYIYVHKNDMVVIF
jgi:hypothetical protein